jgi:hypothetical protein
MKEYPGFNVLLAIYMKVALLWDVASCNTGGCFHPQSIEAARSSETFVRIYEIT